MVICDPCLYIFNFGPLIGSHRLEFLGIKYPANKQALKNKHQLSGNYRHGITEILEMKQRSPYHKLILLILGRKQTKENH